MRAVFAPLRHRGFRRVWTGQLVNVVGDAVFVVAVPLYLLPRPDAATAIGSVLAAAALGGVVSLLVGGALADRHRRSRIIVGSDLVRAAGLGLVLLAGPQGSLWLLVAGAATTGIGAGVYRPAYLALLPTLVPACELAGATALRSLTSRFAGVLGSLLGGLLVVWWQPRAVLALDLVTFLVSILTLVGLADRAPERGNGGSLARDVADGVRFVLRRPWMSAVMGQGMLQVALVSGPVAVCLPLLLGAHGAWYGIALAAEAAGAIGGASLAATRGSTRPGLVALLALLAQAPQLLAMALGAGPPLLVAASALAGVGAAVFAVVWTTALQRQVPADHLGRVMAMDQLTATALSPVGLALAGWAVAGLGVAPVAWSAAAVLVLSVLAVLPVPRVLTFGRPVPDAAASRPR
ncbi:MAG: MFS transporter [Pseudonocardia sp.]